MTAQLCAQDEAIALRLSPRPNQVIHFSMQHEVSTRMEGAPFEVHGLTIAKLTHTVGERTRRPAGSSRRSPTTA